MMLSYEISYGLDIQYVFDEKYTIYSASSSHPYKPGGLYKHKDIMDHVYSSGVFKKVNYFDCQKEQTSDLIIRLKPNFFYNPLMTVMYSELEVDFFTGKNSFITTKKFKDEQVMVFNIRPIENLKTVYKTLIQQVNEFMLSDLNEKSFEKIDGSFCVIL